ncbi:MAG: DNA methyltransferase [Spirochaetes bacterium]|nr:MAG: DNA methyltransferase [Spirochaetota bacterium]
MAGTDNSLFPQSELMDFNLPYLSSQLIAYIGNKRRLLKFLYGIFKKIELKQRIQRFIEPFAGSGSVSRLAKVMGYETVSNDWEFYSFVINLCHIGLENYERENLFSDKGGIDNVINYLNSLRRPAEDKRYIARYFAPEDTEGSDYRTERLFYTKENALKIDAVRNCIEDWYPGFNLGKKEFKEKVVLLASLLYQCATHTNTSGVFKAYHRGFGGFGNDALKRIMSPIRLEIPLLYESRRKNRVYRMDAGAFLMRVSGDLCYIDPPYNQHQYGSNYHLLNTIALWDRQEFPLTLGDDGRLSNKAGIRRDWKKTKSLYCYRDTAVNEFVKLIDSIDARFIVLSYSTEGIVPFETILDIMGNNGSVKVLSSDYTKYRGGKQSIRRENHNIELAVLTDREEKSQGDRQAVRRMLLEKEFLMLLKRSFYPSLIKNTFITEGDSIVLDKGNGECSRLKMPFLYMFNTDNSSLRGFNMASLNDLLIIEIVDKLKKCLCTDRSEEIDILIGIVSESSSKEERLYYEKRILRLLKKFTFKKYKNQFNIKLKRLKILAEEDPEKWKTIKNGIPDLERIAMLRFAS